MLGHGSVITNENVRVLNETALSIYNIEQLNQQEVDCLKKIIMICNVLYNRTDMTVLPIEDGFYDLLLEKYKVYDKNFQVGSAVVEVRDLIEKDLDGPKVAEPLVSFYTLTHKDETHGLLFDKIMMTGQQMVSKQDLLVEKVVVFDQNNLRKGTHDTEHNHPTLVGSLHKTKMVTNQEAIDAGVFNDPNFKILERDFFQQHIKQGIINPEEDIEIVVELKYDGISVEADCDNHVLSARTRGDTGIGKAVDIGPILNGYLFKNAGAMIGEKPIGVKFEAIMTKTNLDRFNKLRDRHYANCRTAIIGLFGASDAYLYQDLITLIPLAVDREDVPAIENRLQEIEFLNRLYRSHGEPLRYCYFKGKIPELLYLVKAFWDEAKVARNYLNFMYDGIVLSYLDERIRNRLGRVNYINEYSCAIKFDDDEKQTIFRGYTYEVGQHGNITPMIHYDPVEFIGTIHTKSSGSSYKRFQQLSLKYGDIINVAYRNDVMPYVSRVECEHNRNNPNPIIPFIETCPVCGSKLTLSDRGSVMLCTNNECPGRSIQRMSNMFQKLNIKGFSDASFAALKRTHLYELFDIPEHEIKEALGEANGQKFIETLDSLQKEPIKDYIVMGSLGFTGAAHRKWMSILEKITVKDLQEHYLQVGGNVLSFKDYLLHHFPNSVLLNTITTEWNFFVKDIECILQRIPLIQTFGMSSNVKGIIRFTGFRNKELVAKLRDMGYDADDNSSVTRKTDILIVPFEGFDSKKVQTAKRYGIKIMSQEAFIDNIEVL